MSKLLSQSILSNENNDDSKIVIASDNIIKESVKKFLNKPKDSINDDSDNNIIIRSESDKFDYKILKLSNGICIVLISDPTYKQLIDTNDDDEEMVDDNDDADDDDYHEEKMSIASENESIMNKSNTKKAAIVVAVKVGSIQDPKDVQGMAHMLEHLLTMGSEKYPDENAIDDFLSSHGGYQNAHTELEHTIYEIKVHPKHVSKAIDLIGSAFVKPLLRQESIDKEIKPIDTEFVQAKDDDDCRVEVLLSHIADDDHPAHKFMWGNEKSLITDPKAKNINVHESLLDFYRTFYQPENMVVVVQAQESLENLQAWTEAIFSKVSKPTLPQIAMKIHKFDGRLPFKLGPDSCFNRFYQVKSIDDGTRLLINWCFTPVIEQYLISPNDYWASLIGYEGKGSLISVLRQKNYAIEIFTDSEYFCWSNNSFFIIFNIDIHLTEIGESNIDTVIRLLFEYLTKLQKTGAQEYYYREKQAIALYSFNKNPEKDSLTNCVEISKNLLYLPIEHVLTGTSLYYNFDETLINDFGNQLTIDKANFMILNKKISTTNIEPWMNIEYHSMEIPKQWFIKDDHLSDDSNQFYYPKPNRFLAQNFELLADKLPENSPERNQGDYPVKIIDENRITIWHKCDFKYRLPNAAFNIHILSPFNENCLDDVALNVILQEYLIIDLQEDTYDAYEARLKWELARTCYGLALNANGFSEKLAELVYIIMERLLTVNFSENLLNSIKDDTIKDYRNKNRDPPTLNQEIFSSILMEKHFSYLDLISKIQNITTKDLVDYKEKFLSNISFEVLVQGNISIKEIIEFSNRIKSMFFDAMKQNGSQLDRKKQRVLQIPPGMSRFRVLTLADTSRISHLEIYQQLGTFNMRSKCYQSLFVEMINEQCFHVLRTLEGLGYTVGCCSQNMFGILGFSIYVSSDADLFDCSYLDEQICKFIENHCKDYINKLTDEKFNEFVTAMIVDKLAPSLNLNDETKKNWTEIIIYDYCFDRSKKEALYLQKMATLDDFRDWCNENIFIPWNQKKVLSVEIVGNGNKALDECLTCSDCQPICSNDICKDDDTQTIRFLRSKCRNENEFVQNYDDYRKRLQFYPIQSSLKDLID